MAVLPVSNVSFKSNNAVSFGKKSEKGETPVTLPHKTHNGATVPVVVLMAMSPALLNNAAAMEKEELGVLNPTEIVADMPASKSEAPTYVMVSPTSVDAPAPQQNITRPWLDPSEKVIYQKSFVSNGVKYNMEWSSHIDDKTPTKVFFVPQDFKRIKTDKGYTYPPKFYGLVLHDNGNDDSAFLAARVGYMTSGASGRRACHVEEEIRLPDDVGTLLYRLLAGKTEYSLDFPLLGERKIVTTESMQLPEKVIKPY